MRNYWTSCCASGAFVPLLNLLIRWCCINDVNCNSDNGDERTSCSADINHLLYYYEKNIISDIDDDNRVLCSSCRGGSFSSFDFLVICLFTYFSWYIFRTSYLLMHNSSPPSFSFYCKPIHHHPFFFCHNSIVQ